MQRLTVASAVVILAFSALFWGQSSTSSLRGIVSDQQGAVVVGAKVNLSNPSTGFSQSTMTNNLGAYQFLQIPPGTYTLTVSMAGFATIKQENVVLQVSVPATANVTMKVMAEASIIDVQSQTVQVNSEDATLGNAFGTQQIESLPFEGRDPTQILSLQPGVTFVGTNINQNQDSRGGSVSGARSDQTNITLDGVDDNDQVKGYAFGGALRSTLDSLQEFRVTTSNANADEGRSSGAQVALITKGGTNNFHGSVYEYNRNNVAWPMTGLTSKANCNPGSPMFPAS
jgi:Carboxypeptidase regulatory-like domain